MAPHDDVPLATDIFLRKKTVTIKRSRARVEPRAPGLFDLLESVSETASVSFAADPFGPGADSPSAATAEAAPLLPAEPAPDPAHVWSVAELVREVRGMVERRYARVTVEGEISNWRPAASGHCYFTLKDGAAQLSVVMFRREASLIRFKPKDGDAVRMRGQVSVYENRGQMQLIAESMELAGIGAQLAAVQELKLRLKQEGLFDNKRPLPAFPRCIGVVTSLQGAALRDIVKVCKRRHAAVNLLVYPVSVQGPRCAAEVAAGVRWFSARSAVPGPGSVDVVMVARGGGSWEDLHGFDDERVARAMAACTVPVVAGIGHATDTTIADAAADVCAPTPSAAAELVTAAQHRVEEQVMRLNQRLRRAGGFELLRARQRLYQVGADTTLRQFRDSLRRRAQGVDELDYRLQTAAARLTRLRGERLGNMERRLQRQDVSRRLAEGVRAMQDLRGRLERSGIAMLVERRRSLETTKARADAMDPLRVLERGYALVYGPGGTLLQTASQVRSGEQIVARLARGTVQADVTATED